jgi:outer membrane protein assembly factor BamB
MWSFCPYSDAGESIYSDPGVGGKRVFIGDRQGYLHCLDLQTGRILWQQLTNKEKNNDVNSTLVVFKNIVVGGTNANMAGAYDVRTGREVWRCKLDAPSGFGPLLFRDLLVLLADSVYLVKPATEKIVCKLRSTSRNARTPISPTSLISGREGWDPQG